MVDFKRLLYSETGKNIISILLGIGLSTLFQKICKDKNCLLFHGPILSDIDGKIFQHDDKCYQYDIKSTTCDNAKKQIMISPSKK